MYVPLSSSSSLSPCNCGAGSMSSGRFSSSRDQQEILQILAIKTSKIVRIGLASTSNFTTRAILKSVAESNHAVEELWLSGGTLHTDLCCMLASAISSKQCGIKTLRLRKTKLSHIGAAMIFSAIAESNSTKLEELYLDLIGFEMNTMDYCSKSSCIREFTKMIQYNRSLKILHMIDCKLRYDGGVAIAKALECNNVLEEVNFQGTNLAQGTGKAFGRLLTMNRKLKHLFFLANPAWTSEDICCVISALTNGNTTLRMLTLHGCYIDYGTAKQIVQMLNCNTTLQKLCLWCNQMSDQPAIHIADCIGENKTQLQQLFLRMNPVGDDTASAFSKALQTNKKLQVLDLDVTNITEQGACALLETFKSNQNTMLRRLELHRNNDIKAETKKEIQHYLKLNRTLRRLYYNNQHTETSSKITSSFEQGNDRLLPKQEQKKQVPLGLWPFAFQKMNYDPSLIFATLRDTADVISNYK